MQRMLGYGSKKVATQSQKRAVTAQTQAHKQLGFRVLRALRLMYKERPIHERRFTTIRE